jgi:hypothetical protein
MSTPPTAAPAANPTTPSAPPPATLNATAAVQGAIARSRSPAPPPVAPAAGPARPVSFGKVTSTCGHRAVLYGPGGIGKTTLACQAPGPVAVIDLDESLGRLRGQLETAGILANVRLVDGVPTWQAMRAMLRAPGWDGIKTIVLDTITKGEELAVADTLATVPHEKGHRVERIEDYGYGKGYSFVYDTFLPLLADLDAHCRAGRNVILVAHDCTTNVPNPGGEDWLRYEPRLQSPPSGRASIRHRIREWADHLLFLGYDVAVDANGKGKGCGSRTLWPLELPFCMAKSRTSGTPIIVSATNGAAVWAEFIK